MRASKIIKEACWYFSSCAYRRLVYIEILLSLIPTLLHIDARKRMLLGESGWVPLFVYEGP